MIEINLPAKKILWSEDKITDATVMLSAIEAGQHLGLFRLIDGIEDFYDPVNPTVQWTLEKCQQYVKKGWIIRAHLYQKVVVYQPVVKKSGFGTKFFDIISAASRNALDVKKVHLADIIADDFPQQGAGWRLINLDVQII